MSGDRFAAPRLEHRVLTLGRIRPVMIVRTPPGSGHARPVASLSRTHAARPCQPFHFVLRGAIYARHSTRFSAASMNMLFRSALDADGPCPFNLP